MYWRPWKLVTTALPAVCHVARGSSFKFFQLLLLGRFETHLASLSSISSKPRQHVVQVQHNDIWKVNIILAPLLRAFARLGILHLIKRLISTVENFKIVPLFKVALGRRPAAQDPSLCHAGPAWPWNVSITSPERAIDMLCPSPVAVGRCHSSIVHSTHSVMSRHTHEAQEEDFRIVPPLFFMYYSLRSK